MVIPNQKVMRFL
ncbi:hypothetical protein SAMN04487897_11894 [Paenibacillus sp. yr247]|nr:hypothetical protein SAMN04487897_11894 [Paenibacillus sp. yr247]